MKKIILTLALLPLLALSERALAIGITTTGGTATSFVSSFTFSDDTETIASGLSSYSESTAASVFGIGNLQSSIASWSLTNTATQAVWSGSNSLLNSSEGGANVARATSIVDFALSETVNYSFAGSFTGVRPDSSTFSLSAFIIDLSDLSLVYGELPSASSGVSVNLSLNGGSDSVGNRQGTLNPGNYRFFWNNETTSGESSTGSASFALTLTSQGAAVPDSGTTLMMLGAALSALGMIRKLRIG